MNPVLLYAACLAGAIGLGLLLNPGNRPLRLAGLVIGLGGIAWLLGQALQRSAEMAELPLLEVIFGLIAIAAAARMVTHSRPVFSALYFILVVLASASMFLLLSAEFMAFALIIVYAGAILITYLFVLMLAQQSPSAGASGTEYDTVPREPFMAVLIGFIMLSVLAETLLGPGGVIEHRPANTELIRAELDQWRDLERMPKLLLEKVQEAEPTAREVVTSDTGQSIYFHNGSATIDIVMEDDSIRPLKLDQSMLPGNTQRVGMALVADFPVSLELAGVILLMAMFGAVVLARKQIELGEDDARAAAGLSRIAMDEHEPEIGAGP
ncbi:MAG: hypothetical protein CMJ32_08910 [Phycisphaerae bacterium]|nr:hypothetical protein [Phycisphaerae bacterium]